MCRIHDDEGRIPADAAIQHGRWEALGLIATFSGDGDFSHSPVQKVKRDAAGRAGPSKMHAARNSSQLQALVRTEIKLHPH